MSLIITQGIGRKNWLCNFILNSVELLLSTLKVVESHKSRPHQGIRKSTISSILIARSLVSHLVPASW